MNPTLLIVGCGKLGIKIGLALKEHFTVIGIKRKPPENFTEFQIISQDIFDETFHLLLEKINPNYLLYAAVADDQSSESYKKAYVNGLDVCINSINRYCPSVKHLFFVSSTRVYGQRNDQTMTESTEPEPNDFGGIALLEGEKLVNNSLIPTTILRLSGIYGSQRTYLLRMAEDEVRWPEKNRWTNRIHEDDAARFISFLFNRLISGFSLEPLYLVTDSSSALLFDVLNHIRVALGLDIINRTSIPPFEGKKLQSEIIPKTDFVYNYPDYKIGYNAIIANK